MNLFFKELFEYNYHINQNLAETFTAHSNKLSVNSVKLFSHILNAHHIWICRIEANQNLFDVWQIHTIEMLQKTDRENYLKTTELLNTTDLSQTIKYTNTKGQSFNSSVRDILFHIINHSTYHRGQIASEFRKNNIEPLITDYIFYKRN